MMKDKSSCRHARKKIVDAIADAIVTDGKIQGMEKLYVFSQKVSFKNKFTQQSFFNPSNALPINALRKNMKTHDCMSIYIFSNNVQKSV